MRNSEIVGRIVLGIMQSVILVPKNDDYLTILTDEEVKDFVNINFSEYNVEILNLFDTELQLLNNKPVIKRIFK